MIREMITEFLMFTKLNIDKNTSILKYNGYRAKRSLCIYSTVDSFQHVFHDYIALFFIDWWHHFVLIIEATLREKQMDSYGTRNISDEFYS